MNLHLTTGIILASFLAFFGWNAFWLWAYLTFSPVPKMAWLVLTVLAGAMPFLVAVSYGIAFTINM
jgi:hypothetical protein